ncbi:hypothetical protein EJ02DRAFT_406615 [Clathrospora elynae]|uniref:C2H2-type domain-containing protein n=1 Tax=Clathrospora elynae TaxID=706981 RepID=A0A6A5SJY0_9PLEO|nr:hypothetical protein EJ02DRAFT_406615 [Clathrospora elynae]
MLMLLTLAVLLAVLLEPVAATSPIMAYKMPNAPLDMLYSECEDLFNPLCELCVIPFLQCMHAIPQAPYVAVSMLYNESELFHMPVFGHQQTQDDLAPIYEYVKEAERRPLNNEHLRCMDADETTVQPTTVQAHIEDTYTPGDRLETRRPGSRKAAHRRQAPRAGGFPCDVEGCDRAFDRQCELNRHQKTHLDRSERPHRCSMCNQGFLYPKDLTRHQRQHIDQPSVQVTFFCSHPGCGKIDGFSRRDNLLRHQRKQHPPMAVAA